MPELASVRVVAQPDIHWSSWRERGFPYQRIVEVTSRRGGSITLPIDRIEDSYSTEVLLPTYSARRLIVAASQMSEPRSFNCHRFARVMGDFPVPYGLEKFDPIANTFRERPRLDNLPAGAIGMIGAQGYGVMHSLVGLGESNPESLQVMSVEGELGIANNREVLDWYRWVCDDEDIHIHPLLYTR